MDKFVLKRKKKEYAQSTAKFPTIKIEQSTYNTLIGWAVESGCSLSDIVGKCVKFAENHIEWEE